MENAKSESAMAHSGRLTSIKDLPSDKKMIGYIKENKKANTVFEDFAYSLKKEYVEWITEAKTESTREKRMDQALEMIAEGKSRNWKYQKK